MRPSPSSPGCRLGNRGPTSDRGSSQGSGAVRRTPGVTARPVLTRTDPSARACVRGCARVFLCNFNLCITLCEIQKRSLIPEQAPRASPQAVPREFFLYTRGFGVSRGIPPLGVTRACSAKQRGPSAGRVHETRVCAGASRARAIRGAESESPGAETSSWQPRQRGAGGGLGASPGPVREGQHGRGGLLSHRVVVQGGAAQAQRQIAVIRKFKRLGEGLSARDGPQVCLCPQTQGSILGVPGDPSSSHCPVSGVLSGTLSLSLWVSISYSVSVSYSSVRH